MEFLQMLATLYLDGYTFTHTVSIVWMVSVNGMVASLILAAIDHYRFYKKYLR